ncbi:MAG: NitT/TauT family transport system substrate-binding protein, partial [Methanohalophilus sp.]
GDLDVAYVGAAPFVSALSNGLDAKVVAGVNSQGSDLVLRPEHPYEGPEDLKGLSIATFPPGTIQDTILRDWLKDNGIDPDNDVDIKPMGPGDAISAISAGRIDAAFLPHPAPTLIEQEGNGRSVVYSGEMLPDHACCVLVVLPWKNGMASGLLILP